jgi:hypothetical protein
MTDGLRAHNLLKHLDWIKPILQLDFNYVKLVYERLTKSKPDHILLNYYDVPAADVAKIFPNQPSIVSWLVGVFQFNKPNCGKCVMVLDLLTTLSILTTGSITDKCKLLFTMYNINQTGLMDEGEHYNFIMRSSDCMKKLKFMGTLDMTSAEAKYVALEARVKHENNQITFIPGLYLPDFTRWVQTSKECQTLFRFVKVLNRLVDSMLALESRTNAVLHIMEAKHNYKLHAPNVPPLAAFPQCKASSVDVWLVFTNHACASVIIPLHRMGTTEVFVKCEKVVPLDSALYEVPRAILKRKKKVAAAAAKSKRAQRQREEEERLRKEEVAREIAEIKASQVPDGYLIIGCVTTSIATPDFTATVTNPPRVSIIGDFMGTEQEREEMHDDMIEGIPTAYDFIQLPEWFRKFSPSMESMFVRDEVLLLMRQNPETKRILNVIEDGDYIPQLIALYEKSRLSELSRPEDLREVDMGITGVVPMFFRDLVKKMWDLAVPAEVKPHMFSLSDEFIMSYCFARALPDTAPLSSGIEFARAVQYTLVLSLSLRSAQIMSKLERYAYIIRSPDYPTQKVKAMEQKEKIIVDEKFDLYNRKEAADKAWRLADPKAADERDRLEKEAAEEAAALEAAQLAISKKDVTAAAALKAARELEEMARDVEKTLAVVEINYDSDLEAIENDEAVEQRRIRAAERLESIKQHDVDHTTMSIKMHTSQRAERVKAEMTSKERAAAEEEEGRLGTGEDFDVEAEGMEKLDQMRSEWLVAAMEVVMEVAIEKEIYDAVKAASHQLLEECFEEARANKLSVDEEGRLEHAKLQVSRLRSETAKSRRVYGRRMSFMA